MENNLLINDDFTNIKTNDKILKNINEEIKKNEEEVNSKNLLKECIIENYNMKYQENKESMQDKTVDNEKKLRNEITEKNKNNSNEKNESLNLSNNINENNNKIKNNEKKEENKKKDEEEDEESKEEEEEEDSEEEKGKEIIEKKEEDKQEENKKEEDEKKEDEKEEDEKDEDQKEEDTKEDDDLNKKANIKIKTNKMKKIEKEIEESCDRITYLKEKLIESRKGQICSNVKLSEREINSVIEKVLPIIQNEPVMLELEPPIYICGDIHGQFYDLLRVFDILKYPPESKFLFLGDYVDRGKKSLECILLLLCLKIKYPSKIYLLRGNHESESVNRTYGFFDECKRKISIKIYKQFCTLFNFLPITALVGGKILCMHGGLSYDLKDINQLKCIKRPTEIPESGLLCDLVWSDPDENLFLDFCTNNERGISICFSKTAVDDFIKNNDVDLICRAHQVVEEGFQFFADMKLITIFTAPNYMGEFDNKGGILKVNEDMICSLSILKPDFNSKNSKRRNFNRYVN